MEAPFLEKTGVVDVCVGYMGGDTVNPTYEDVCTGMTGHVEAVRVEYDENKVSYTEILDIFWNKIDPTDDMGQMMNRGSQYRSAIFYSDDNEKEWAEKSKLELSESGRYRRPIVTRILPFKEFYKAEEYHQHYYKKLQRR